MDSFEQARQLFLDGLACIGREDLQAAEICFTESLEHLPDRPSTLTNRAAVRLRLGRLDEAEADAARAVAIDSAFADAWLNLALIALERRDPDTAAAHLQTLLWLDRKHHQGWLLSARVRDLQGRLDDAADCYRKALAIKPDDFVTLMNLGAVLNDLGRFDEALEQHDRALSLAPLHFDVLCNRGVALAGLGRYGDALGSFERAVPVDPSRAEGLGGKAMALVSLGRQAEALPCLEQAHRQQPQFAPAWSLHGAILAGLGQLDEALQMYERAVELSPANAEDVLSLSHLYLGRADFARGWPAYEARLRRPASERLQTSRPRWDGSPTEARVFVWAEQGVGDQVLYSTMFPSLFARLPNVTISADEKLLPLFRRSFPQAAFTARHEPPPEAAYDLQLPVGSLGTCLRPSAEAFAHAHPAVLVADAERARQLRASSRLRGQKVCGISWKSVNAQVGDEKSMPLERMRELLMLDGFTFVNLQYGDVSGEIARTCALTDAPIETVPGIDLFEDIDGLAALIDACDIVVTISNSTAHLAGAMGKPVLLLLPRFTGRMWYWNALPGGDASVPPWYPSVRMLHQHRQGDWEVPLQEAKAVLEHLR
ncbi:MAG: tetratricopeptide repeat protein [bacterium]|jgi:tetratricopeptide (TPR) repeat protein|nr:tetratricopeptide repeat protein [Betaproteobacteria bacterium]